MGTQKDWPESGKAVGATPAVSAAHESDVAPQQNQVQPAPAEPEAVDTELAPAVAAPARQPELSSEEVLFQVHDQASFWRTQRLKVVMWRSIAVVFMGLGGMGVVLPVMPHVPFFLVALWAAGKGWPELEQWLLRHPTLGPQLTNWKERKAISLPVKLVTTLMMTGSAISMQLFGDLPLWLRIAAPCFMLAGAIFMWTRPSE